MGKTKSKNVVDYSDNRSNAAYSHKRGNESTNFMEAVKQTDAKCYHRNDYSKDLLSKFFREDYKYTMPFTCTSDDEKILIEKLFQRIAVSLDFYVYVQRKVVTHLKGKFSSEQLSCIFQAYKGMRIQAENKFITFIKEELYNFIDNEGKIMYDIGDVNEFKSKIESINPLEFEIFVNLILEVWGIEDNMIGRIHERLLNVSRENGPNNGNNKSFK